MYNEYESTLKRKLKRVCKEIDALWTQPYNKKKMLKLINDALDYVSIIAYDLADTDDTINRSSYGMKGLLHLRDQIRKATKLNKNDKAAALSNIDETVSIMQGIGQDVMHPDNDDWLYKE